MITTPILWVMGILILIVSAIDLKFKKIPSILLTAMLFTIVILNPENIILGLLAGILALLLYEGGFFGGVADIKVMSIIGFMVSDYTMLFLMIILTLIYGFVWKVAYRWRLGKDEEVAFIPVFFLVYLSLWLVGGFA